MFSKSLSCPLSVCVWTTTQFCKVTRVFHSKSDTTGHVIVIHIYSPYKRISKYTLNHYGSQRRGTASVYRTIHVDVNQFASHHHSANDNAKTKRKKRFKGTVHTNM